jgi:serine/threonine protein kinase
MDIDEPRQGRGRAASAPAAPVDQDGSPLKQEARAVAGAKGDKQAAAAQAAKERRRQKKLKKASKPKPEPGPEPEPAPAPEPAPEPASEPHQVRARANSAPAPPVGAAGNKPADKEFKKARMAAMMAAKGVVAKGVVAEQDEGTNEPHEAVTPMLSGQRVSASTQDAGAAQRSPEPAGASPSAELRLQPDEEEEPEPEPEPERAGAGEGGYVPFGYQAAVEAQKSLESAGVDTMAELLSATVQAPEPAAGQHVAEEEEETPSPRLEEDEGADQTRSQSDPIGGAAVTFPSGSASGGQHMRRCISYITPNQHKGVRLTLPLARSPTYSSAEESEGPPSSGGSRRSSLARFSSSMSRTQTTLFEQNQMENQCVLRNLMKRQRAVESKVEADDLTATWDDQQIRGKDADWRRCLVGDPMWHELTEEQQRKYKLKQKEKQKVKQQEEELAKQRKRSEAAQSGAGLRELDGQLPASPRPGAKVTRHESKDFDLHPLGAPLARPGTNLAEHGTSLSVSLRRGRTGSGGDGGHGKVLRAVWRGSIKVAIKVFKKEDNADETRMFRDLRHPHLVFCYGILEELTEEGAKRSIVTERCTINLQAFLRKHGRWQTFHDEVLTQDKIDIRKYTILEHVSQGLQVLHDMSVLHRDLKCLNILLDGEAGQCQTCGHSGNWKICDFGEAKILKTPTLSFHAPQPWTDTFDSSRFVEITAASLLDKGAQRYCWLHPGETKATAAGDSLGRYASVQGQADLRKELEAIHVRPDECWDVSEMERLKAEAMAHGLTEADFLTLQKDAVRRKLEDLQSGGLAKHLQKLTSAARKQMEDPLDEANADLVRANDIIAAVLRHYNPYPHGALVYSFSENPEQRDPRDCVFAVAADPAELSAHGSPDMNFPDALKPFNVIAADELNGCGTKDDNGMLNHVHVDLEKNEYFISKPNRLASTAGVHRYPQVSLMLALWEEKPDTRAGKTPTGRISKPHTVGQISPLHRRRYNIPPRATHYVFAYQLPSWTTQHFSTAQLKDFTMYTGEISLVSYGGFIYLRMRDPWDSGQPPRVVGVNALSMGPPQPYQGGAVVRPPSDLALSKQVASPELWAGSNIGLETDIYAFGIVMWEVFTRRVAWHWHNGDPSGLSLGKQVRAPCHMRPKIPKGMMPECAKQIRSCLQHDPTKRPSAKDLADWLRNQREGLENYIRMQRGEKVRERDQMPSGQYQQKDWSACAITKRSYAAAKNWNNGLYSLHFLASVGKEEDAQFELSINPTSLSDWEERAIDIVALEPQGEEHQQMLPTQTLGFVFGEQWPVIEKIRVRGDDDTMALTLAQDFPEIRVGCELLQINDIEVRTPTDRQPYPFKVVKKKMRVKNPKDPWAPPLRLRFSVPKKMDTPWATKRWPTLADLASVQVQLPIEKEFRACGDRRRVHQKIKEFAGRAEVPVWVIAGLDAVAVVRENEKARKAKNEKRMQRKMREQECQKTMAELKYAWVVAGQEGVALVREHEDKMRDQEIAGLKEQLRLAGLAS